MSQTVGVDPELIAALTERQLWTFHVPADSNAFESIIPVIDGDPRVKRGGFAIGVRVKAVKEGDVIAGALESVVSTGPGAFRNLNDMPLPRDFKIRISEQGTLRPVEREVAERLWRYLLSNDLGLVAFVKPHLAEEKPPDLTALFDDFGTQLRPWHRDAIERAVAVANVHDRDLTIELLFAGFLYDAEERRKASTLAHVAHVLTEGRSPVDLLSVLGLRPAIQTLEVPQRALIVSRETYGVVIRLLSLSNRMRASTEDTADIRTRHVAAAFLVDEALTKYLASLDFDVTRLRTAVFDFVTDHVVKVDRERWRAILGLSGKPQTPPSTFAIETIVSRDTWTTEDKLGYELYAQAITESILKGDTEPPLTIGIQAPWGQGKTSLMRMMQEKLDKGSSNRDQVAKTPATVQSAITTTYRQLIDWTKSGPRKELDAGKGMLQCADGVVPTIWFNPLYYRETSQVWAGMAHAMLHQLVDRFKDPADRELFWFRLQQARINTEAIRTDIHHRILQRFLPYGVALVVLTVLAIAIAAFPPIAALLGGAGITGGAYATFNWITKQKEIDANFDKYVTEPNYRTELGLLHLIDHDLDRALGLLVGSSPIAVFIDDLDRCDPQTVNQVILAINQFLSLPRRNVFFFLGMDMEMVAAALEQAQKELGGSMGSSYRRSFGWRFMEKFVQLPFVIPHLEREHAQEFAEAYLRGQRAAAAAPPDPGQLVEKVASAATLDDLGAAAKLPADTPPEIKQQVQQAASTRAAELMQSNDSDEMKAIAKMAVQDLELNPRTIVRYFCLVRVLRNIQIAAGKSSDADTDRKLIIRAAHLLMNWPQFVQWLRNEPETLVQGGEWTPTVGEIATLASKSGTLEEWCEGVTKIARSDKAPAWLADASLYRYLRKLADGGPGLQAMYDARVF